ncbi:MAG: DUF2075 domain-containing protein [Erysipelotrichia bacterium]|nr:DUF2075 domain-containing protein [Erysipelotrichia bacterium]
MIVYEALKSEFISAVTNDTITADINRAYEAQIGHSPRSLMESWHNSMEYMFKVLIDVKIPDDAGIAIEFKIPMTSKRIDFIITGFDKQDRKSAVIIELKQWQACERVSEKDGVVRTAVGKGMHEVLHPSYQVDSYRLAMQSFSVPVQNDPIELHPCAYLHNYNLREHPDLDDVLYQKYIQQAPIFTAGDVLKLRLFIDTYIHKGDQGKILFEISEGKIHPSRMLQDSLASMLAGNQEFVMIDDQKLVFEEALKLADEFRKDHQKRVMIVKGGPGTGKSVVAVNLLVELTRRGMMAQYATKNSAPREVYFKRLKGRHYDTSPSVLFKGSGSYVESGNNDLDVILADEAHRLNAKSGMFHNLGENQIKEIIHASGLSVFFIDEHQRVTLQDIGSVAEIEKYAEKAHAEVISMKLESQFRCSGSDGYLSWIDDVLDIRQTANSDFDFDYDFRVYDDPEKLRKMIVSRNGKNKARMVAGYCWKWISDGKNNPDVHDIVIDPYHFAMSWNLSSGSPWADDAGSVDQCGCIHTCQGLEFETVGVLIGDDMRYENGRVITDYTKRAGTDQSLKGIKKMMKNDPVRAKAAADEIIRNTYRTLLTRGSRCCGVFCTDPALREYLRMRSANSRKK